MVFRAVCTKTRRERVGLFDLVQHPTTVISALVNQNPHFLKKSKVKKPVFDQAYLFEFFIVLKSFLARLFGRSKTSLYKAYNPIDKSVLENK